MKKRKLLIVSVLILCVLIFLFLPIKPIVQDAEQLDLSAVTRYYKGQQEENLSKYLEMDSLELYLQLYKTSIVPTIGRGQRVDDTYYVIEGTLNGKSFTITADNDGAFLFYLDQSFGYRIHNGEVLQGMIYSSAYDDFRDEFILTE